MSIQTKGTLVTSKKKRELQDHIHTIESEVEQAKASLRKSIATSAEKLTLVVPMTERLKQLGKEDQIDPLLNLAKSMGQDIDTYIKETENIDKKYEETRNKQPNKLNKLSGYNAQCMAVGSEYESLNARVAQNLLPSLEQLFEIADLTIDHSKDDKHD